MPDNDAFRKAIDSTTMLTLARFFMPVVVAVIGYFITSELTDLKAAQQGLWIQMTKMVDAQASTNAVTAGLTMQVNGAVKQLDHLQTQVDNLQKR